MDTKGCAALLASRETGRIMGTPASAVFRDPTFPRARLSSALIAAAMAVLPVTSEK